MAEPWSTDPDREMKVYLQGRYGALLRGEIKVEDLDDEELARGQLRASDGTFRGRPPKVIPADLVTAMRRTFHARAEQRLREALMEAGIGGLVEIAKSSVEDSVRLRAQLAIIERMMGKVPDRIHIAAEDPVETLFKQILSDPGGLLPAVHEPSAEERALLS